MMKSNKKCYIIMGINIMRNIRSMMDGYLKIRWNKCYIEKDFLLMKLRYFCKWNVKRNEENKMNMLKCYSEMILYELREEIGVLKE